MSKFWKRSLSLVLTLVLTVSLLSAFAAPASAATLEEQQQALVATALAYWEKGVYAQYDGRGIVEDAKRVSGGKTRSTNQEAPEYATKHETLYTVCSDFMHQIYWETFRYSLFGCAGACTTMAFTDIAADDPTCIYSFKKESGEDPQEAIRKMVSLAQPGDVFTSYGTSGHSLMYVGDIYGDGVKYLAHSFGSSINVAKARDVREYPAGAPTDPRYGAQSYKTSKGGTIRLNANAEETLLKSYGKGNQVKMSLVRPLNVIKDSEYPITPAAKFRMAHPRLSIDRVIEEHTRFTSPITGEKLTLTVTLSNGSKTAYSVPVTEKIPAGVKLLNTPEGASLADNTLTWTVELPAGEQKVLTMEYEVTAKRGEKVVFTDGSVGDIPSNTIPLTVGGAKLSDADKAKLEEIAAGKHDEAIKSIPAAELADHVYQNILGLKVRFPEAKQIWKNLTELQTLRYGEKLHVFLTDAEKVADADKLAFSMLVPTFHGGYKSWNEWGHERINDPKDIHVEAGDVIVRIPELPKFAEPDVLIYLGNGKYLNGGKTVQIVEEPELVKSLLLDVFCCLRPTLAYDDLHTLTELPAPAPAVENKFTDVKEGDWFCTYVKDLAADGTVSGMTETTFAPNGTLTYGQALKLIVLALGEAEPAKSGTHWASGYLTFAKEKGWLTEDVPLDGAITRLALCKIAAKARGFSAQPEKNPFTDTKDEAVLALNNAGVIDGMTAETFCPDELLTRAQIAKIIWMLQTV